MDRKALALECLEVEAVGGSVRQFLLEHGCLSPWGTWYRLQIEELGRKDAQITDGKGDEEKMKKITLEQKKKAVQIAIDGGDPLEYLRNHGSKNPSGLWWTIKNDVKSADPELYAKIPMLNAAKKKPEPVKAVESPEGVLTMAPLELTDTQKEKIAEKITVRKEEPEKDRHIMDGFTVTSIRGKYGEYHKDTMSASLDFLGTDGETISMRPEAWKEWLEEVSRVLGLFENCQKRV